MKTLNSRPMHIEWPLYRWFRFLLETGGGFALFVVFVVVVGQQQFETFATAAVPIIAIYFATSGLLYNRARALSRRPSKTRSLYAAERSTQATIFSLVGIIIGVSIFSLTAWFGLELNPSAGIRNAWALLYFVPLAFIMGGYRSYLFCIRAISKEFLHPLSAREISRRIKNAP